MAGPPDRKETLDLLMTNESPERWLFRKLEPIVQEELKGAGMTAQQIEGLNLQGGDYFRRGPYNDTSASAGGTLVYWYECTRCDFRLVTVAATDLLPENRERLDAHRAMHEEMQHEEIRKLVWQETNYQDRARQIVVDYFNSKADPTDNFKLELKDVFVVWFCKTLQNWKVLASTTVPDGMYYEITYDGNRKQAYLDAYKKMENVTIQDEE
jgi:Family of unknown function (DUF6275)